MPFSSIGSLYSPETVNVACLPSTVVMVNFWPAFSPSVDAVCCSSSAL